MFGVKEGHTIFCDKDCSVSHHEVLVLLLLCKRNDLKTLDRFKQCVNTMVAHGWDKNSDIPDQVEHFRFPLVHWAAVYGKLAVLKWLAEEGFDLAATNTVGETALHRLVACQAHERAVDPRCGRTGGRRFSLANIVQVFTKVLAILTDKRPQVLLRYEYIERNTPFQLCLKLLNDAHSQRLTLYYESLFKVLCERLGNLLSQEKLSAEFVRSGLACRDKNGNTMWHIAAASKSTKVLSAVATLVNAIEGLDLNMQNDDGDTPCMVALINSFPEMASVIEDYKSSKSLLPVVKMEALLPESDECCCERRADTDEDDEGHSLTLPDIVERSDSSCLESSTITNASWASEQSFTEPLKKFPIIEQQKLVLTPADQTMTDEVMHTETDLLSRDHAMCHLGSELEAQVDGSGRKCSNIDVRDYAQTPETLVIEKQIDLCASVTKSANNSTLNCKNEDTEIVCDSKHLPCEERCEASTAEQETEDADTAQVTINFTNNLSHCDDKTHSEILNSENHPHNIQLPSPPNSENCASSYQIESISDMQTPKSAESGGCKVVSVTPVLLVKLLSEPDVSERFQRLLKDVITGDKEKVGSAQSTLQHLKTSKSKLEDEINKKERGLQDIMAKRALLSESIKKLQQEAEILKHTEEATKLKLTQLKEEHDHIGYKIHDCEFTCKRLKRRLSDCVGALDGISPKMQKK